MTARIRAAWSWFLFPMVPPPIGREIPALTPTDAEARAMRDAIARVNRKDGRR